MTWDILIKAIGGYGSLVSALGVLCVLWFQYRYNKQLGVDNAALQRELAIVTAELAAIGKRHEIAFGALHNKRAEVIAELYQKIVLINSMLNIMSQWPNFKLGYNDEAKQKQLKDLRLKAEEAMSTVSTFIDTNKIYFLSIFKSLEQIRGITNLRLVYVTSEIPNERAEETWKQIDEAKAQYDKALLEIEELFQKLLEGKEIGSPGKESDRSVRQ